MRGIILVMTIGAVMYVTSIVMGNYAARNVIISMVSMQSTSDMVDIKQQTVLLTKAMKKYNASQYISPIGFSVFALGSVLGLAVRRQKQK